MVAVGLENLSPEAPVVDIASALISIKTIAGIAKDAGKIDITQHVISLQQTLMGLQAENAELATEKRDLANKVAQLQKVLDFADGLVFEGNAYWRGEGDDRDGPFCSRCFDAEGKAIRLIQNRENVGTCHNCKNSVRLDGPVRPRPAIRRVIDHGVDGGWVNGWKRG